MSIMKLMFFIISMMVMSHPVSIILYILCMSVYFLTSLIFLVKSSWFSLIFMLMVLGGLMVLFIYMASLSSNEYFKILKGWNFLLFMVVLLMPVMSMSMGVSEYILMNLLNINSMMMFLYYLIYLLLVLILIIEMLVSIKSSLRLEV
uniref:NADH dehydrogenase subunit 6 n=1 Tax=Echinolaelaps traubi TaxID=3119979 RepID=A0AAU6PBL5_9ACAR